MKPALINSNARRQALATCGRRVVTKGVTLAFCQLAYYEQSAEHDIVFLNGLLAGSKVWVSQYRNDLLLQGRRAYFLDYRCQGESTPVCSPFSLGEVASDVRALCEALCVRRPILIGHSLGGLLALTLAASSDGKFMPAGLVLVNCGERLSDVGRRIFSELLTRLRVVIDEEKQSLGYLRNAYRGLIDFIFGEDYARRIRGFEGVLVDSYMSYNKNPEAVAALVTAAMSHDLDDVFIAGIPKAVNIPSLMVIGGQDAIFPAASGLEMAAAISASSVHVMERCGHSAMIEQPAAFNMILRKYLDDHEL